MDPHSLVVRTTCLVVLAWCVWDMILETAAGNDWTISWNVLGVQSVAHLLGVGLAVTLMTLVAHLTCPTLSTWGTSGWFVWVRAGFGLLPVVGTFLLLLLHPAAADIAASAKAWAEHSRLYPLALLAGATYGIFNGAVVLAQHPE